MTEFCDDIEPDVEEAALEDANPDTSYFTPCPLCNSDRIAGMVNQSGEVTHEHLCQTCGCQFSVHVTDPDGNDDMDEEEEDRCRGRCRSSHEEKIRGLITACPHCAGVETIKAFGGYEWCTVCWLRPDELDQPSGELARLFKGGIRKALEKGIPILHAQKSVGKFVRTECGPHCTFAKNCPQTLGNLARCFNDERNEFGYEPEDSENVGKRKRGKKKKGKKSNKQHYRQQHNRKTYNIGPPTVAFFCARGGLLEKMILHGNTDPDTEQPGNTGSQSGA